MTTERRRTFDNTLLFNRFMYVAFVLMAVYFYAFMNDIGSAMSNLGLALIFDPFDHRVTWANRPPYQRIWLILHVALVFILFGTSVLPKLA